MEIWLSQSITDTGRVNVKVTAYGYETADLRGDYAIDEAYAEEHEQEFSLALLRRLLTPELATAVARELDVPYSKR